MKLHETIPRIRAAISVVQFRITTALQSDPSRVRAAVSAVQTRIAAVAPIMVATVRVPYIVYDYVLGIFVRFLSPTDTASVASDVRLSARKPLADQYAVTDYHDVATGKRLTDAAEVADALAPFQIGKFFYEYPKVEEGPYFAEDYTDPGYTIISFTLATTKGRSDAAEIADAGISLDMTLGRADIVALADSIAFMRVLNRADAASVLSTVGVYTTKPFADQYAAMDYHDLAPHKRLTDSTTAVDTVEVAAKLGIVDATSIADSGSIRMQDYCDYTYFAEDYVGEARTF